MAGIFPDIFRAGVLLTLVVVLIGGFLWKFARKAMFVPAR